MATEVSTDLSIIALISEASVLVQLVMLTLVIASFVSWIRIFTKRMELKRAREEAESFEESFWSGRDLITLFNDINVPGEDGKPGSDAEGSARIFHAGFREFARMRSGAVPAGPSAGGQGGALANSPVGEGTARAMRVALSRQTDQLERHLSFLATVGSTSPYIGLFGTVWGIMNSFRALGNAQAATIAHVAPGIAEALIATAMGLFAAIPAVIAYNRFQGEVDRIYNRYDNFIEEFVAILQRQAR